VQEHNPQAVEDDGEANDATSTDASCADQEELQPEMPVQADQQPRLEVRFLDRYSESNISTDFSFDEATSTAPGTEDTASSGHAADELALTPPYRPSGEWSGLVHFSDWILTDAFGFMYVLQNRNW
jgi:hypothetical protein